MKKTAKLLALVLALVLVVSAFTGCGGTTASSSTAPASGASGSGTVSYTHLDVYKRQGPGFESLEVHQRTTV